MRRISPKKLASEICLMVLLAVTVFAQDSSTSPEQPDGGVAAKGFAALFSYLNMAGTATAADFRPMTQKERAVDFGESMVNPFLFFKGATSGALDHWRDKPEEWGQGGSGYGRRVGNILAQYTIQRTITYGLSTALHEDTRYFGSGKKGFWPRTSYAVTSSVLARRDDGRRFISVSQLAGFAGAAVLSRRWQPPSTDSMGDAAVSFGVSMGINVVFSVVKEFLPDASRKLQKKQQPGPAAGRSGKTIRR